VKDTEYKSGKKAVTFMKECGSATEQMAKEPFITLMAMFTKVNGATTRAMALENTFTLMVPIIEEIGLKTSNMVRAKRDGQMVHHIQETMSMEGNMVMDATFGETEADMTVNSTTTTFKAKAATYGAMDAHTQDD